MGNFLKKFFTRNPDANAADPRQDADVVRVTELLALPVNYGEEKVTEEVNYADQEDIKLKQGGFDYTAYDRFVEDEDFKDPDADDDEYKRQFILVHKTDPSQNKVVTLTINTEIADSPSADWEGLPERDFGMKLGAQNVHWQVD